MADTKLSDLPAGSVTNTTLFYGVNNPGVDQIKLTGSQIKAFAQNGLAITGLIQAGTNVTLSGSGTTGSPYVISAAGGGGGGTPGGSTTQVQYNNGGAFGGMSRVTSDGNDLILTPQASPTFTAWKLVADSTNRCFTAYNADSNVSMQIGKEGWVTVYNNTGSTIPNGRAVYPTGYDATTNRLTVALASNTAANTALVIGVTTEDIPNNSQGEVTVFGDVNGIDTSAFTAGSPVFLGTNGQFISAIPAAPLFRYKVGTVGKSDATTGFIQVAPTAADVGFGTANQIRGMNAGATGNEYKTLVAGTNISITHAANQVTIASSAGSTSLVPQSFNGTGSQTAFVLSTSPAYVLVFISGVYQPPSQYTLSGNTVTFNSAPPAGTNNVVINKFDALSMGAAGSINGLVSTDGTDLTQTGSGTSGSPYVIAPTAALKGGIGNLTGRIRTIASVTSGEAAPLFVGGYVDSTNQSGGTGTRAYTASSFTLIPFPCATTFTSDQMSVLVTTAAAAGSVGKIQVYDSDSTGQPNNLVVETAAFAVDTVARQSVSQAFQFLSGQLYWLGFRTNGAPTVRTPAAGATPVLYPLSNGTQWAVGVARTLTYATASPSTFGSINTLGDNTPVALIQIRIGSVP